MRWLLAHPMTFLLMFAIGMTAGFAAYLLAGISVSPAYERLASVAWPVMVMLWADADARRLRKVPCYDFGLFIGVFFPLSVIWYCVWSRGWRGILAITCLVALWLAPYVAAGVLWQILYGQA